MTSSCVQKFIYIDRLKDNLRLLRSITPSVMPVLKADAYGHGIVPVAKAIEEEGVRYIALGNIMEAFSLRQAGSMLSLVSLLGISCKDDVQAVLHHNIIPVIYNTAGLQLLVAQSRLFMPNKVIPIVIKFDTGMGRLGFSVDDYADVIHFLKDTPEIEPVIVMSHLATADTPNLDALTALQIKKFVRVCDNLKKVFPNIQTSLGNSAAMLSWPKDVGDIARPGLALFGINPLYGTKHEDIGSKLIPVMEVVAPVLSVSNIKCGESISYGATFTALKNMRTATIGVGYADGYARSLSNKGWVLLRGNRYKIVGRICMQMCIVDITENCTIQPGDRAYLLGGEGPQTIKAEDLAEWWGTIPYEVLCALGRNASCGV